MIPQTGIWQGQNSAVAQAYAQPGQLTHRQITAPEPVQNQQHRGGVAAGTAQAAARVSGKPLLVFQLLGNLDDALC